MLFVLIISGHSTIVNASSDRVWETDLKAVIESYEKALNGGNTNKVLALYAQDGVFMPSNKPTATGHIQVKEAYINVFKSLDLNVSFHVKEIDKRSDIAFVRTVSDGQIKLLNKGDIIKNHSRELFVMKNINGHWKIYRYMFNETNLPETM